MLIAIKYNVIPVVEIKRITDYTQLNVLINTLEGYGLTYKTSVLSPVMYLIDEFRARGGKSEILLIGDITSENTTKLIAHGNAGYSVDHTAVNRAIVDSLHAVGLKVGAFIADSPSIARNLKLMGVDYITTDTVREVQ